MKSTDKEILEMIEEWQVGAFTDSELHELGSAIGLIKNTQSKLKAKPQPKCKYEKVREEIFDLKADLNNGVLYAKYGDNYEENGPITTATELCYNLENREVVRKVEVDPVEELAKKMFDNVNDKFGYSDSDSLEFGECPTDKEIYMINAQYVIDHKEEL